MKVACDWPINVGWHELSSLHFNPSSPNIKIYILLTTLSMFLMVLPGSIYSNIKTFHLWWSFHSFSSEAYRFSWHVCFISSGIRDFKIQRRGRDESRPEVKIPKMTTTAHDRDVNKPRPCSRRTRWRPFWRCWQTVSISTYFDLFKTVNWHFLFVYRKLNYPGYIPHVFFCCCFLSGSVELANSKHKKHQLPWPRIPNRSE